MLRRVGLFLACVLIVVLAWLGYRNLWLGTGVFQAPETSEMIAEILDEHGQVMQKVHGRGEQTVALSPRTATRCSSSSLQIVTPIRQSPPRGERSELDETPFIAQTTVVLPWQW